MKVLDLFEAAPNLDPEIFEIFHNGKFEKHTHEELISATKNNLTVDLSTDDDWYIVIIPDVPPISKQKFLQLLELSFQPNNLKCNKGTGVCIYENFFHFELVNHKTIADPKFTQQGWMDVDIMKFSWKEFVLWINEYYQDLVTGEDDFTD